jgi:Putative heavy-metal-binding
VVCELDTLTDAWNLARRRALDRLSEQALQVGADAVVGVHLDRSDHDLGRGTIEYVVTGTAIRVPGSDATRKVSGGSDAERRGWVITMHAAGTAIRSGAARGSPQVKTSMRMR